MSAPLVRELLVATRSEGKLRELMHMLEAAGLRGVTLPEAGIALTADEDSIECYDTFEENALAKARWFSARSGGLAVLADDSGLSVDALGGAPGVRSKRWALATGLHGLALDAANNATLVREIAPFADRRARYVCVAAIVGPDVEMVARGECVGRMLDSPSGTSGFGYDPYFFSEELGMSFGVATIEAKERVSHRGRATHAVLEQYAALRRARASHG